jgi:hypothetical protein
LRTIDSTGRRVLVALAALMAGGLIAACGGSSSSSSTRTAVANAGGSATAQRAALRKCLSAHGVTLPARPRGGAPGGAPGGGPPGAGGPPGGGVFGGGGGAGGPGNPKVRAALQACGAGNLGRGRRFQLSHTAVNSYVACVRQHGYNMPSPNFSGKGPVFPAGIRSNPAFQGASRACQSLLFPNRGRGTASTTA